jgi:hypothetical protein
MSGTCGSGETGIFPKGGPWTTLVDTSPLAPDSETVVRQLALLHRDALRFATEFSLTVLQASPTTARRTFVPTSQHYVPDCDSAPVPLVPGGHLEGESGYACLSGGDCHLLVNAPHECKLYEMWRADLQEPLFRGGCLAVWDTSRPYPANGRGVGCSSADAAGLPIAPLLFSAEEIRSGAIRHAIRFVLPNEYIRTESYVAPATHATRVASGGPSAPPYGARLRLKPSFDLMRLTPSARIVALALQRYGMFLADGGRITFTATHDGAVAWTDVGFNSESLKPLSWTDFQVVDSGAVQRQSGCVRSGDPASRAK